MAERILLTGSTQTGSGDVQMLLARAFSQSGHETHIVSASDDLPFWSRVARKTHLSHFRMIDSASFSRHFYRTALTWKPTVIFVYGSNIFVFPRILEELKQKLGCQILLWEVNNNFFGEIGLQSLRIYDHVFALDSYILPVLQVAGAKRVSHLPACADPQEHYPIPLPNDSLYHADVSFLGSPYPNRVELLKHLVNHEFSLRIYGDRWHAADPSLQPFISDIPVLGLTKSKIFTNSRISLNMQGPRMINAENFRVFEVAASAGVSFSTYKPDLVQSFTPDKEIIIFRDANELKEKIEYYLNHLAELDAIKQASHKRFLSEHTYQHRVKTIEKIFQ
jgi:spore maturation protein CgeB